MLPIAWVKGPQCECCEHAHIEGGALIRVIKVTDGQFAAAIHLPFVQGLESIDEAKMIAAQLAKNWAGSRS